MGGLMSSAMDSSMQKQQDFMVENQQVMLERNMNMQNAMRERMMAMQIARMREMLNWTGSFFGLVSLGLIAGAVKNHQPHLLAPLLPFSYIVGYQYDMAYNGKMIRITKEAEEVLKNELELVNLAMGLPTVAELDSRRAAAKK